MKRPTNLEIERHAYAHCYDCKWSYRGKHTTLGKLSAEARRHAHRKGHCAYMRAMVNFDARPPRD